jgi:hypothetical protein
MKTLQSNFTTSEQSKRLLELGVPADSADLQIPYIEYYDLSPSDNEKIVQCYEYLSPIFWNETERGLLPKDKVVWEREFAGEKYDGHTTEYIPCWSACRLMEIFDTCLTTGFLDWCNVLSLGDMNYIDYIVYCYEKAIEEKQLDFSKLEE